MAAFAVAAVAAAVLQYGDTAVAFSALAFGMFGGQAGFVHWGWQQARNARTLVRRTPLDTFAQVIDALEFDEVDTRAAIRATLRRLIPQIDRDEYGRLSRDQRQYLIRELSPYTKIANRNEAYSITLLDLFTRCAEVNALGHARRLARTGGPAGDPDVRRAAQKCAESIESSLRTEGEQHNLLLPSDGVEHELMLPSDRSAR